MASMLLREAFPLAPAAGRTPFSDEAPSAPETRPWALRFARVPDSTNASVIPAHFYDPALQVNMACDGGMLTVMQNTHSPTVPDGDTKNPPPLDEGAKD